MSRRQHRLTANGGWPVDAIVNSLRADALDLLRETEPARVGELDEDALLEAAAVAAGDVQVLHRPGTGREGP
jgi:hypothetical protein